MDRHDAGEVEDVDVVLDCDLEIKTWVRQPRQLTPLAPTALLKSRTHSTQFSKVIENRQSSEEAEAAKAMQFDTTRITSVMPEAKNTPSAIKNK